LRGRYSRSPYRRDRTSSEDIVPAFIQKSRAFHAYARSLASVALLASGILVPPCCTLNAQPGTVGSAQGAVPTAGLLRRVAEAVAGHRSLAPVWVVGSEVDTIDIIGVFESRAAAEVVMRRSSSLRPLLMGPYTKSRDEARLGSVFLPDCQHDGISLWGPRRCPPPFIPFRDIDNVSLTVRLRDGTVRTIPVPTSVDAVFFSISALDKFVIPYYARRKSFHKPGCVRRDRPPGNRQDFRRLLSW
jgi:hypothetical protein